MDKKEIIKEFLNDIKPEIEALSGKDGVSMLEFLDSIQSECVKRGLMVYADENCKISIIDIQEQRDKMWDVEKIDIYIEGSETPIGVTYRQKT